MPNAASPPKRMICLMVGELRQASRMLNVPRMLTSKKVAGSSFVVARWTTASAPLAVSATAPASAMLPETVSTRSP
jgi:hypothetical protein